MIHRESCIYSCLTFVDIDSTDTRALIVFWKIMSAVRNMDQMEVLVLLLIFGNIHTQSYIPLAAEIYHGMQRASPKSMVIPC